MKKYTNKELKKILDDLNAGRVYVGVKNNFGVGEIYCGGLGYIFWKNYGSSAEKISIDNLRYIVENIFSNCDIVTPAIYSEYHINYIPENPKYKAIDFSFSHPNVYGV